MSKNKSAKVKLHSIKIECEDKETLDQLLVWFNYNGFNDFNSSRVKLGFKFMESNSNKVDKIILSDGDVD
jgi:hypothetical protein